jgi:mercuric ion transport protein
VGSQKETGKSMRQDAMRQDTKRLDQHGGARTRETGEWATGAGWTPGAAVASIAGALGAASCCLLPLILVSLGVGGAWIGNLTALAPYQPFMVAVTFAFLGAGFYRVYRRRPQGRDGGADCAPGGFCATRRGERLTKAALWFAALLVALAVTFNYTAPYLLGV